MRVRAATPPEARWLTERTGYQPSGGFGGFVAEDSRGIRGMVVFDLWTPSAAHLHIALDTPAAGRCLIRPVFRCFFVDCGRLLARGEVRESNLRSLALALHLGFRQVRVVPDGWAKGEGMVELEMRRDECRWIGGNHE
jgi:hypothetical protein